jgi:two-component system response regulator DevR
VDDHDIVRRGLRDLLVDANDIDVVGDSGSVREAVPEILRLETDVMLLDLQLQDGTGVEVCRAVRSVTPSVSGLLLTAAGDDEALGAAVLAGAAGYMVKLSRNTDIVGAIRRLRPGTSLLDPGDVQRAQRTLSSIIESLTPRVTDDERRILDLVLAGQTDSQIADGLPPNDLDPAAAISGIVTRVTQALLRRTGASAEPGTGRHRRTD